MYKREVILVLRMKEIKENIKKATDSWNYILPAIKKGGADSDWMDGVTIGNIADSLY